MLTQAINSTLFNIRNLFQLFKQLYKEIAETKREQNLDFAEVQA